MVVLVSLVVLIGVSAIVIALGALLGAWVLMPLYQPATARRLVPRAMLSDLFVLIAQLSIPLAVYADLAPRRPNDNPLVSVLALVFSVALLWALAVVTASQLGIVRTAQRIAFVGVIIPAAWFCIITLPIFVIAVLYQLFSNGALPWWAVAVPSEAIVLWLCRTAAKWILAGAQSPHPQ